jgi:L-lactate utilization protein LutB
MNNFFNDPLGAMKEGLSAANQTITTNVKKAAENIKNNEQLRENLRAAKEKAGQGLSSASSVAANVAGRL